MQMITEVFGDVVVLHTQQDLNDTEGSRMQSQIAQHNNNKLVVDLDATERIDSPGLETLVNVQGQMRERQGDLRISVTSPIIRKILEITRLDQQIEVYDCIIDAVRSYD